jgi:hypothetical protein
MIQYLMGTILKIILSNRLNLSNIPRSLRQSLIEKLTLQNPRWIENARMNRWNWNTEKLLWNEPLNLHRSQRCDQSVSTGICG